MTRWYVTTGVSIRAARCWNDNDLRAHDHVTNAKILALPNGGNLLHEARKQWLAIDKEMGADASCLALTAASAVASRFRPEAWSSTRMNALPAELATLVLLRDRIQPDDEIHLLCGRTNYHDALVLVAMLKSLNETGALTGKGGKVSVQLKGPYAWDPKDQNAFDNGMRLLWREIDLPNSRFVLTAGFKAVLLWITNRLSLRVRTTDAPVESIPVFYRHEEGSDLIRLEVDPEGAINSGTGT
jgi:hypothetical protein